MCGIAGQLSLKKNVKQNFLINNSLSHRGPHNKKIVRLKKKYNFLSHKIKNN